LLGQDYPNLELIVSDNASTDGSERICRSYAQKDSRLRFHRNERDLGAISNFNQVFDMARGEYFMWAAFDDLRDPRYVSACVNLLQSRPDAVLCCTEIRFIDEDGIEMEVPQHLIGIRPAGTSAGERLRQVARAEHWYDFYGLGRVAALRQTRRAVTTWGFDGVVLLELCLRGPVLLVPEPLFSYRRFRAKTPDDLAHTLAGPGTQGGVPVCWSCMTLELLRAVMLSPHPLPTRLLLLASFVLNFCMLNKAVAAAIRSDLAPNIRSAAHEGKLGRVIALATIGALIYPLHNPLTRAIYRGFKRRSPKAEVSPATELSKPR
jgi:hypothetical protein